MTKELLQQALDALIESRDDVNTCLYQHKPFAGRARYDMRIAFYEQQLVKHDAAIEGLKQALALAQQEQYPLPDSLYPGSKDWQAGSYKERVEWLHLMYESAKQEVARLESQQEQLAQEPKCNPHPKAPHGFMRNSSHSNDRYVCECERWEPYEAGRAAGRQEAFDELDAPPTQPALSDDRQKKV